MKRSTTVLLVLSGSLLGGCNKRTSTSSDSFESDGSTNGPVVTNNTHIDGRGYYHAPYRAWYPFPYNSYRPGSGYYHGGRYNVGSPGTELEFAL